MSGMLRLRRTWPFSSNSPRPSIISTTQPAAPEGPGASSGTEAGSRDELRSSQLNVPEGEEMSPAPEAGSRDRLLSSQTQQPVRDDGARRGTLLPTKVMQSKWIILFYITTAPVLAFLFWYIHAVLVSRDPQIGHLWSSPSKTLLIVSMLSQSYILLLESLLSGVFNILRWQLASRDNEIPVSTFLGLTGATSLWGLIVLMCRCSNLRWGFHRYIYNSSFNYMGLSCLH
jgi:hypothetical protein